MNDDGRLDPFAGVGGSASDEERVRAQWQQPDATTEQQRSRQARRLMGRRPLLRAIASGAGILLASAKGLELLPTGPDGAYAEENISPPVTTTGFVTTSGFVTTTGFSTTTQADTTPPTFSLSADLTQLTPANGAARQVTLTLVASDSGSGLDHFTLSQLTSNQTLVTGDTSGFVPGTTYPPTTTTITGTLKASITPGTHGRVYTIAVIAYDKAGNDTVRSVTVQVKPR